ncbi:type I-C CRISPR-associated endonuclease Cas1c [Saccharibacillus alkalitolerans]|uniref:CRISPR-associated endonuclease Cas1 n=1 Tax=Saccharibacillus alkalitolerans TaxID=2705290 RepID=A0ABX0F7Q5_9BACL|nr:type I-C CRISPR-associated endonuclease Cas1c [Saccharibacillus alkalitolerans]NGZ74052.1 type I-C CRISPR-associated endonuclease Cas1 [Saccharibacillus alkalitolerans]
MRKLLNTLYVTAADSYLARDGENVLVLMGEKEQREKFRVPVHNLEQIVTFGYTGASPAVFQLCAERGIGLTFLNEYGNFQARIQGKINGNVLLRRKQYRMADGEEAAKIAGRFIQAKIINSRSVLRRALRDHAAEIDAVKVTGASNALKRLSLSVLKMPTGDTIRGAEGEAARIYFGAMNELVLGDRELFQMQTRNRRPPLDPMNALLSLIYTLLRSDVQSALETVGLDPAVGFLHRDRPGRASLALDLMEELRPYLADRLVLSLINRRQLSAKSFVIKENGAVLLKDDTRKDVLAAWQKRKQEEIVHPYLGEKIPIGLLPYAQALLLARHIRGDIADYPPFLWK